MFGVDVDMDVDVLTHPRPVSSGMGGAIARARAGGGGGLCALLARTRYRLPAVFWVFCCPSTARDEQRAAVGMEVGQSVYACVCVVVGE